MRKVMISYGLLLLALIFGYNQPAFGYYIQVNDQLYKEYTYNYGETGFDVCEFWYDQGIGARYDRWGDIHTGAMVDFKIMPEQGESENGYVNVKFNIMMDFSFNYPARIFENVVENPSIEYYSTGFSVEGPFFFGGGYTAVYDGVNVQTSDLLESITTPLSINNTYSFYTSSRHVGLGWLSTPSIIDPSKNALAIISGYANPWAIISLSETPQNVPDPPTIFLLASGLLGLLGLKKKL